MGNYYEHVGLMMALYTKGLLDKGDYFVVGIDTKQYDPLKPDKYLRGSLMDATDLNAEIAFQSYVGIMATASVNFDDFAKEVSVKLQYPYDFLHKHTLIQ